MRRGVTKGLTLGTAAATALATLMIAPAAIAAPVDLDNPKAPSAAHGQALALEGLGLDLLGAANSTSEFGGQQGGLAGLDLSVLGQDIKLGTITLPLLKDPTDPNSNGLLELGDVSLLRGYSETGSEANALASSGTITEEGGLNLSDSADDDLSAAKVDLTALLGQLGLSGITDGIINELSLEIGALGARVEKKNGTISSEYGVAGVEANVGAPLVGGLTTGLSGLVSTVGGVLNGLVGDGGLVDNVLGAVEKVLNINLIVASLKSDGVRAQVNGLDTLVDNVLNELLLTPIKNESGSVNVDLANGTISLDLAELAIEGNGYTNLNELPANTSLLNADTVTAITNGVTEALLGNANPESLMSKLTAILTDHLWNNISIDIFIDAKVKLLLGIVPVADTTIQLTGSLAEFAGYDGASLGDDNVKFDLTLLGILPLGDLIEPIVKPLLKIVTEGVTGPLLTLVTQDVIGQLQPLLSSVLTGLLDPVLTTLEPVLSSVATVTINEQPKPGDLGAGSHTTNAVAVKVLPGVLGNNAVSLELGNASVKAADAVPTASLTASPSTVKPGGKVTLAGKGYSPNEEVTISSVLGANKKVTANATGAFTAEWVVPAKQAAGKVTFTATGGTSKRTATATVTVQADTSGANASANSNATTNSNASTSTNGTANSATNANASASASAAADGQATAAAKAAAMADASTSASAKATANAQAAAKTAAQTNASTNASTKATASAQAAAQAAANSKNNSDSNASGTAKAEGNASAAAKAAANQNASTNASSKASANSSSSSNADGANSKADVNASASAAADSNANAAAKAAAMADATTAASAKATASANAAAKAAANPNASTKASSKADASARAAAQAAANHKGDSDTNSKASAKANSNASAASKAAAIANASSNASGNNPNPNTAKCRVPSTVSPFLDTAKNHKFFTEIDWMYCMGYTTGIKSPEGLIYGPQMRLSREAMAAFIFRMEADPKYKAPKVSPFADMKPGDKFYREIAWMYEQGLSTGIKQETGKPIYGPKLRLSREAMAAFIYRLEAPKGYYAPLKSKMADMKYGDKFYTEINWMVEEGLSTGIRVEGGDREYWPKSRLSREAMAAFIYRLVNDYREG